MNNKLIVLIISIVLVFTGCTSKPVKTNFTSSLEDEIPVLSTTDVKDPLTVSDLAKENFLLPFEKFSWEREYAPEYVMIHFTSAVMISKNDPYNMDSIRKIFEDGEISIHYIIERDGTVQCYIPENRAAWHAGKGSFGGYEKLTNAMNKYSIGIEIAAIGSQTDMSVYMTKDEYDTIDKSLIGFTEEQYASLIPLVKDICERNSIPFDKEHVIGHSMYKPQKTDPGELFEWDRLFGEIN